MSLPLDLLRSVAIAIALTAIWLLILWGIKRLSSASRRRARAALIKWGRHNSIARLLRNHTTKPAEAADLMLRGLTVLVMVFATYEWLIAVFKLFDTTLAWGEALREVLSSTALLVGGAIVATVPDLFVVAVIAWLTWMLVKLSNVLFGLVEAGRLDLGRLDAEAARATRKLVAFGCWVFALVMAYPYLPGSHSEAFKGMSVMIGLVVSLGSSSLIAQTFSGLILIYARTLRRGEYVRIGETEGTVLEIGLFATYIETGTGEHVVVPNSQVMTNATRNFSRTAPGGKFVAHTQVTLGYGTPWRQVHAMLLEAAAKTAGIAKTPQAYVLQTALSDFYIEYRLVAFSAVANPSRRAETLSLLHQNILDVFNTYGVQIMSPHYRSDPPAAQVVPPDQWAPAPAMPVPPTSSG